MKAKLVFALFGIALLPLTSFAEKEIGNGGDICEDQFKIVRDDIASWIHKGGSAALSLPNRISLASYNSGMLSQISDAQVSCTEDKVFVGNAEKTCKNFIDSYGKSRIVCNSRRFLKGTSESGQYVLVHHEYAGLAGFEVNDGENSHYSLSNQISQNLTDTVVKRLAVKGPSVPNMYQKLSALYETGTLPDLNTYFQKAAAGRCFNQSSPNSPVFSVFSVDRKALPDSGPLNPDPRFDYDAFFWTSTTTSYDSTTYQEFRTSHIYKDVIQVDERMYSTSLLTVGAQRYTLMIRQNGNFLVGRLLYSSGSGNRAEAFCYYYRIND
jgi:hypothetical protein